MSLQPSDPSDRGPPVDVLLVPEHSVAHALVVKKGRIRDTAIPSDKERTANAEIYGTHQRNKKSKSEILGNECDAEVLACVTNALLQEPSGLTDFSLELTTTTLYKVEGEAPRPRILVWIHCGVKTTDHRSKDPVKVHYLLQI